MTRRIMRRRQRQNFRRQQLHRAHRTFYHRRPFNYHNQKLDKYSYLHQGDRYNYNADIQHRYGFPTKHNAISHRRQLPIERQSGLILANPFGYALAAAIFVGLIRIIGVPLSTIFEGFNPGSILNGKYIKSQKVSYHNFPKYTTGAMI